MNRASLLAVVLAGLGSVAGSAPPPLGGTGKGVRRVTSSSRAGRSMTSAKGSQNTTEPLSEHNRMIEAQRQAKLAARKARRGAK